MAFPRVAVSDVTQAEPALYGILSPAVTVIEDPDTHWTAGAVYESLDCGTSTRISSICSSVTGVDVVEGTNALRFRDYQPFVIETNFKYSTFNGLNYEDEANERMIACQQKTIEAEFWTGALAQQEQTEDSDFPNRFLASSDAVDLTPIPGTAVKPKWGLAILEDALGSTACGVRGTIHMTRGTASSLGLSGVDGVMQTSLANYVVAGAGYDGSGPDGTVPPGDQHWMYVTGPLTVRLGDIVSRGDIDSRKNTVEVYADRSVMVTWDTCVHAAVLIDLSLDYM